MLPSLPLINTVMKRKPNRTTAFAPIRTPVENPYIGFTSYQRFRDDPLYSDIVVKPENNGTETEAVECYPVPSGVPQEGDAQGFYPHTEVAYFRILWKEFEPERKEYDFALIRDILDKAKAKGQTVMFRLMPHSTRASDDVPEWLKTLIPCPERPSGMRVKESPSSPLYLHYFGEAVQAIADRFDDDPTLYAVDISLTGAWGEGHKWEEYPEKDLKALIDVYTQGFRKTLLIGQCAAPSLAKYAAKAHPCGWRGDGVGEKSHMTKKYPKVACKLRKLWKTAPVSFESYWWLGEWARRGWDIDDIIEKTLSWHVSTFNAKSLPIPLEWKQKIEYWISRMGYHFVLKTFEYPVEAKGGDLLFFRLSGENRGVAPIYRQIPLRVCLRKENERYFFATDIDVRSWLPGRIKESFSFALPDDIPAGEYEIALTLSGEDAPAVRWENENAEDGFLQVGQLVVRRKTPLSAKESKEYLSDFLRDFDYPTDTQNALFDAFQRVFSNETSRGSFEKLRATYEADPDMRFSLLKSACDKIADENTLSPYVVYLLVLILLSESSKWVYALRGLSEKMWRDNMTDLKYTADLCAVMKKTQGTYCPEWYAGFFSGKRVTFGRLQFEPGRTGKPYRKGDVKVSAKDTVIYIHIPRTGENLSPEKVDAACAEASAYFKEKFQTQRIVFACHSWLLYPENKHILSETSNLASFISRFDVIDVQEDTSYQDVWRLFDVEYAGDPNALPQDTSLRRAYARRIKEGKPLGQALGVWIYDE